MALAPGKPRILIVDDDPDFISDITILLSSEFEIASAQDTVQAGDSWKKSPPECILLDLQMPKYYASDSRSEGLSFIAHLRKQPEGFKIGQVPVIVVTSSAGKAHIARAHQLGISNIYSKPFDIKKLVTTIWSLIESRKGANS